jgi:hypothetical protein
MKTLITATAFALSTGIATAGGYTHSSDVMSGQSGVSLYQFTEGNPANYAGVATRGDAPQVVTRMTSLDQFNAGNPDHSASWGQASMGMNSGSQSPRLTSLEQFNRGNPDFGGQLHMHSIGG